MTIQKTFGLDIFIFRFIFALVVLFSTYNPEGYSYFHWIYEDLPAFSVLKAFIGVILLICWIILIRATLGSLGAIGILLAASSVYQLIVSASSLILFPSCLPAF